MKRDEYVTALMNAESLTALQAIVREAGDKGVAILPCPENADEAEHLKANKSAMVARVQAEGFAFAAPKETVEGGEGND